MTYKTAQVLSSPSIGLYLQSVRFSGWDIWTWVCSMPIGWRGLKIHTVKRALPRSLHHMHPNFEPAPELILSHQHRLFISRTEKVSVYRLTFWEMVTWTKYCTYWEEFLTFWFYSWYQTKYLRTDRVNWVQTDLKDVLFKPLNLYFFHCAITYLQNPSSYNRTGIWECVCN